AVKSELPESSQQPILPPMVERFDVALPTQGFEITFEAQAGLPRSWFISSDDARLVQLQPDRFSLNWRRSESARPYPHYGALRADMGRYVELLVQCVTDSGRRPPEINLVEVLYVNHVELPERQPHSHADLARIINRVRSSPEDAFLGTAEDTQFQARWRIPTVDQPSGRLYLSAVPGLRPPGPVPIYVVNVTGRVLPKEGNLSGAMEALDLAHQWIVLGFVDVTTPEMHELWDLQTRSA
ncbi:MAG: TIGR04255 family protein, partial [Acidimicrobiia bacterium]